VEELGVFVPLDDRTKLAPLLLVGSTGQHQPLKSGPADNTKSGLIRGEGGGFLKKIEEVNQELICFSYSSAAMPNLQVMHVSHELYILHYLFFLSMPYRMSVISYIFFLSWLVYVLDVWSILI
jgi:hypothetical protein